MRLDRNVNADGKGKYALVRLRGIEKDTEAYQCLRRLTALGHLDWGVVGQPDEFFVVKLRDRFADGAITGYSNAVMKRAAEVANEPEKAHDLMQYAMQVQGMSRRAGILSEFCKDPD